MCTMERAGQVLHTIALGKLHQDLPRIYNIIFKEHFLPSKLGHKRWQEMFQKFYPGLKTHSWKVIGLKNRLATSFTPS